ncbi:MAG: CpsD/CapB family tyrosine-protein kinase, partial [Aeromicrobium sp.]|uniref:polysaccharide biosynthesis tyrosine autokinase n=1 Tax=Aeromicrobium sp. TaxID=1871063 RepID=UPI003C3453B7
HGNARTAAALSGSAAQSLITLLEDRGIARVMPATSPSEEGKAASATVVASVVDESGTASRPSSPSVSWWLAIGALIGLLLGLAVSAARQLTHRPIRTPDDLTEATGAPMLAAIGYDRTANRNPLVTDLDPGDPRFEASRLLRTNLQFVDVDSTETVLTVTSSMPGEGKSTTVANLAIALAHGGASVVLVDADLRRPQLDELFGLDHAPGLTTALVGTVDLADAVQETSVHGLDVLTTGALPPNPSELLQTNAMADLVLTLRRRYDIVLFDAPPLLPVTDAALLATLSDGAVLLVRHGRTTAEQVRAAAGRLESVGADLLGTVLTMVPARGIARYGYGYEYQDAPKRTAGSGEGRRARR